MSLAECGGIPGRSHRWNRKPRGKSGSLGLRGGGSRAESWRRWGASAGLITEGTCPLFLCPEGTAVWGIHKTGGAPSRRTCCPAPCSFYVAIPQAYRDQPGHVSAGHRAYSRHWPKGIPAPWERQRNQACLGRGTWGCQGRLPGGGGWKQDLRGIRRSWPDKVQEEGKVSASKQRDMTRLALSEGAVCWVGSGRETSKRVVCRENVRRWTPLQCPKS